jgi:hypothetical protein
MKVFKKSFYNNASSGIFIAKCPRSYKLKKNTLLYAPVICDYITYKNESKQPVYLGSITGYFISIERDVVFQVINDLIKNGYIIKNPDDRLEICQNYMIFKMKTSLLEIEKNFSSSFKSFKKEDFKEFADLVFETKSIKASISLLSEKIENEIDPYFNFFDGFYRHYIDFLLEEGVGIEFIKENGKMSIIDTYFAFITINTKKIRELAINCYDHYLEASLVERSLNE